MKKLLILAVISGLYSETFNVSTTAELRTALENAAMNGENDTIVLADGTYNTADDGQGRFEFLDNEPYDLTLKGSSRDRVILSGNGEHYIFRHQSVDGADLKVENLTFKDGGPAVNDDSVKEGGAISTTNANIEVTDCNFSNNHAYYGGAIYSGVKDTTVSGSVFENNIAWSHGGGIYAENVTVNHSLFKENKAQIENAREKGGGGFFARYFATVRDSNFTHNISNSGGGGFYCQYNEEVSNSRFIENEGAVDDVYCASNSSGGGGFHASNEATVVNSYFYKNRACAGGGFSSYDTLIIASTFIENNTTIDEYNCGGGVYTSWGEVTVYKSLFQNNYSQGDGGAICAHSDLVTTNTLFTGNRAGNKGAGIFAYKLYLANSIISNNTDGIYLSGDDSPDDTSIIKNSIFINNNVSEGLQSDISGTEDVIITLKNNYIDLNNVYVQKFSSDNIFENVVLEFSDQANADYHIGASSDLIDAGINEFSDKFIVGGVNYLAYDFDENNRSVGANMDIGLYEYSTTKPTINTFSFSEDPKQYQPVSFNVDYTLSEGRTVKEVSFDYLDNGTFVTESIHVFNEDKTYNVTVKITDDAGEFSLRTISVPVATLSYDDMNDSQKLVEAINPAYYEDILSIINKKEEEALAEGEQYVIDNPESFGLVTETSNEEEVAQALLDGIETGKLYVQDNPDEFDLVHVSSLTFNESDIDKLPLGWSLVGTMSAIDDLSIFDKVKIVWIFDNQTKIWSAYSSDDDTKKRIEDSSDVELLTTIPAGSGIWVEK